MFYKTLYKIFRAFNISDFQNLLDGEKISYGDTGHIEDVYTIVLKYMDGQLNTSILRKSLK